MLRSIRVVPALACGLVLLTACGSSPATVLSSASTEPAATTRSPSVPNPLSLTKLDADPCGALTATELEPYIGALDQSQAEPVDGSTGPSCDYEPADGHQAGVDITALPEFGGPGNLGKSGIEWSEKSADIAGYPAEHQSLGGPTGPQNGDCGTIVAISDQAAVNIYVQAPDSSYKYYSNLCVVSDALAPYVIVYLKSGR